MERPRGFEDEAPEAFDVVVRIGRPGADLVRHGEDVDLGEAAGLDHRRLGVGLADVDDEDALGSGTGHSMWKTVTSGTATGALSGAVAMMSAICSHQRRITG